MKCIMLAAALAATIAAPAAAWDDASPTAQSTFGETANAFIGCLKATVQMGMTTRMDPDEFKVGLAKSCLEEEAAFRSAAVELATANGKSEADALAEVEGNIANGRRVFAADQQAYIETGKVPR